MSQTSYALNQSAAQEGQLSDVGNHDIVSKSNAAAILFGKFVAKDSADGSCKAPAAATDVTNLQKAGGVVVRSQTVVCDPSVVAPQYPLKSAIPVLRKGRIWVKAEDVITAGTSTVNVRYAGTGDKGSFLGAAVSMETALLPDAQAKWLTSTSAINQLALLEINL